MTATILVAIAVFAGGAALLALLLVRLFGLRGKTDESSGSQEHWVGYALGSGDGGGD